MAKLSKLSVGCWCYLLHLSSLTILIDFLLASTLTALSELRPLACIQVSRRSFSGVCVVVVYCGGVEVTQAAIVWVTVPVCTDWWVRSSAGARKLEHKGEFLSNPKIDSWTQGRDANTDVSYF